MKNNIWQTPGNSTAFDCDFSEIDKKSYTSKRSMIILTYLYDNFLTTKSAKDTKSKLKIVLEREFSEFRSNNSEITHFVNPLIFYGFVDKDVEKGYQYNITTFGRRLIESYRKKEYEKCRKLYIQAILS